MKVQLEDHRVPVERLIRVIKRTHDRGVGEFVASHQALGSDARTILQGGPGGSETSVWQKSSTCQPFSGMYSPQRDWSS